jgi:hypothetical protein
VTRGLNAKTIRCFVDLSTRQQSRSVAQLLGTKGIVQIDAVTVACGAEAETAAMASGPRQQFNCRTYPEQSRSAFLLAKHLARPGHELVNKPRPQRLHSRAKRRSWA